MKRAFVLLSLLMMCHILHAQVLEKTYGNKFFTLNYPDSWEIVMEDDRAISNVNVSVQVMAKKVNDIDFRPNVSIIKSAQKWTETTEYLAAGTIVQIKKMSPFVKSKGTKSVVISTCCGTMVEYEYVYDGYPLHFFQYIIKKADNTTFSITCTVDNNKLQSQKKIVDAIVRSIVIK